ncbi:MAG: ABC transporter ATP-binding protein [Planctomycetota bacterium]
MNPPPLLSGRGITIRPAGWDIVRSVDVDCHAGRILALLGPNGAGKTTLLRGLLGFLPLHAGRVLVQGRPVQELDPEQRARLLAYVPQRSQLAARLSARAVVELGRFPHCRGVGGLRRQDHEAVDAALAATDCSYLSGRGFVDCSGGEQARLLVARALATEAPCLLLDEPAASLDIAHALELYRLLRRLADGGKAVLVVLHRLEDALRWADEALLLECGETAAAGAVETVLRPELIERVYRVRMIPGGGLGFAALDADAGTPGACG